MKRTILSGAVLALVLGSLAPQPVAAQQRMDQEDMNAALAAIIALGIGVAIARHGDDHDLNSGWDEGTYGEPFSPSPNVVCLPIPRQCYERSHFSARWTRRIFGN